MKSAIAALAILIGSCGSSATLPASNGRTLDPVAFFAGNSHGEARLSKIVGSAERVTIDSVGRRDGRGGLILDQTIREGFKPARVRRWTIIPAGPGRYTGALTDADGPVGVSVAGPRANIRYHMKGGLNVEQQLALQPDGRTILNHLLIKKFGVQIAKLDETIRKR